MVSERKKLKAVTIENEKKPEFQNLLQISE